MNSRIILCENPKVSAVASMLLRIIFGLMIATLHGWHKVVEGLAYFIKGEEWHFIDEIVAIGFPLPAISGMVAGLTQLIGGVMIAAGLLTRAAAFAVGCTLIVAIHANIVLDGEFQLVILYALLAAYFTLTASGRISMDYYIWNLNKL